MDIRILIVEDEPLIAEDIQGFLESIDFTIAGIAYDGVDALKKLELKNYDAVLLDINLGAGIDGIQIADIINEKYKVPFVFLTSYADRETIDRVKKTRPAGYLLKPFDENDLLTSLEIAVFNHMNNMKNRNQEMTLSLLNAKLTTGISEREFEVLNLLKKGMSNKEIGEANFVSVNTVKTHLQHIYTKFNVRNRTELVFEISRILNN